MKRLLMELDDSEISYKNSSNLQGVLFERISPEYAEFLHMQQRHPYSQCLLKEKEKTVWCVNALDEKAEEEMIEPLAREDFDGFTIRKSDKTVKIVRKTMEEVKTQELVREFYSVVPERIFRIQMLTAASFHQKGKYIIYPDMRLFYQSLMNKYSAVSTDMEMLDEDILEMLAEKTEIVGYHLRTARFPLEGINIPSFIGNFTVRISGADTIAAYARMLFEFGEYAGVGVKTAMGMGAFRLVKGEEKIAG